MGKVLYSVNSHRKIVHLANCRILARIPQKDRRSFASLNEAAANGYRLCNCCPPVAQKYRKERIPVKEFCRSHGFTVKVLNGVMHVISRNDCWRLIVDEKRDSIQLYHKNREKRAGEERHPGPVPGYHRQNAQSKTILGYLKYIDSHDAYRDKTPYEGYVPPFPEKKPDLAQWFEAAGYNREYLSGAGYIKFKGGKKSGQARRIRQQRHASVVRVNALLEELAVIGY